MDVNNSSINVFPTTLAQPDSKDQLEDLGRDNNRQDNNNNNGGMTQD